MNTALRVTMWIGICRDGKFDAAQTRGFVAARLVLEGHCATRRQAHNYVKALLSNKELA